MKGIFMLVFVLLGVILGTVASQRYPGNEDQKVSEWPFSSKGSEDEDREVTESSFQYKSSEDEHYDSASRASSGMSCTTPTPDGLDDLVTLPRAVVFVSLVLILSTTLLHILFIVRGVVSLCRVCSSDTRQDSPRLSVFGLESGRNSQTSSSLSPHSAHLPIGVKNLSVHFDDNSGEERNRRCIAKRHSQEGFLNLDRAVNQGKYSKRFSCGSEQTSKVIERKISCPLASRQETRTNNNSPLGGPGEYTGRQSHVMGSLPTITIEAPREDNMEYYLDSGSSSISVTQDQSFKSWIPVDEGIFVGDSEVLEKSQPLLAQQKSNFQIERNAPSSDNETSLRDPAAKSTVAVKMAESKDSLTGAVERSSEVPHFRVSSNSPLGRLYDNDFNTGRQSQDASQQSFRECFCYVASDPDILHFGYLGEGISTAGMRLCPSAPPVLQSSKCSSEAEQEIKLIDNLEVHEIIDSFEPEPNVLEAWNIPASYSIEKRSPPHSMSSFVSKQAAQVPLPRNTLPGLGAIDSRPATQPRRFSSFEAIEAHRRSPSVREHRRSFHGGDDLVRLWRQCAAPETSV